MVAQNSTNRSPVTDPCALVNNRSSLPAVSLFYRNSELLATMYFVFTVIGHAIVSGCICNLRFEIDFPCGRLLPPSASFHGYVNNRKDRASPIADRYWLETCRRQRLFAPLPTFAD